MLVGPGAGRQNKLGSGCRIVAYAGALLAALMLAACSTAPKAPSAAFATKTTTNGHGGPTLPAAGSGRGGYYKDDGPGDITPEGLLNVPDAVPTIEPYSSTGNKPYVVYGKTYTPLTDDQPFKQRGIGSWYGKKFHHQKTSSGELYDMYKMTAAHPTLPIPSYARVTNLKTGAQVIVRVNDRGPFLSSRIIDLSYTAALKLGYLGSGSGQLEVERLLPADIMALNKQRQTTTPAATMPALVPLPQAQLAPARDTSAPVAAVMEAVDMPLLTPQPLLLEALPAASPSAAPAATRDTAPDVKNSAPAGGFYLQLGAYSQQANADTARDRLLQELTGVVNALNSVAVNGLYRLYAGPYANRADADNILQQIRQRSSVNPIVVPR